MSEGALDYLCAEPIGISVPYCEEMVRRGLAEWTGRHHAPEWRWKRDALAKLPRESLRAIYDTTKATRPI